MVKLPAELFVSGDDADKEPCGNTENSGGGTAAIAAFYLTFPFKGRKQKFGAGEKAREDRGRRYYWGAA